MVLWDGSPPSSWSAGFPNKVTLPCPDTSSLDGLASRVASSTGSSINTTLPLLFVAHMYLSGLFISGHIQISFQKCISPFKGISIQWNLDCGVVVLLLSVSVGKLMKTQESRVHLRQRFHTHMRFGLHLAGCTKDRLMALSERSHFINPISDGCRTEEELESQDFRERKIALCHRHCSICVTKQHKYLLSGTNIAPI